MKAPPEYIAPAELADRLQQEVATLDEADWAWWKQHSIAPFVASYRGLSHYVVAAAGRDVLYFADDEDEFGSGRLEGDVLTDCGLFGDLQDAIRGLRRLAA